MNKYTLHKCATTGCNRLVRIDCKYCCAFCEDADRRHYEPFKHTTSCDERNAQRSASAGQGEGMNKHIETPEDLAVLALQSSRKIIDLVTTLEDLRVDIEHYLEQIAHHHGVFPTDELESAQSLVSFLGEDRELLAESADRAHGALDALRWDIRRQLKRGGER
jgi:hypothetical protein